MLTQLLTVLKIVATLFPMIPVLVERFETPGVSGDLKKQGVMDVLKAIVDGLEQMGVQVPGTMILTICAFVIDAIVAGYNAIGLFRKTAQALAS